MYNETQLTSASFPEPNYDDACSSAYEIMQVPSALLYRHMYTCLDINIVTFVSNVFFSLTVELTCCAKFERLLFGTSNTKSK